MSESLANAVDLIFVPKQIAAQCALLIAMKTSLVIANQMRKVIKHIASSVSTKAHLIRELCDKQTITDTQDEWMELAEKIDVIQGHDVWRKRKECDLYEAQKIQARIDKFVYLLRSHDIFELMFTLRGGIGRNHFGLLHDRLFSRALAGTKHLVENYHRVVCDALDFVCDVPTGPQEDEPIPTEARLAFFNETRHSYGRTAFMCSGGAALGFYHVGVIKALMLNGVLPRILGGSSAGSIVTAMVATRTDEECIRDFFEVKGTIAKGHSGQIFTNFFEKPAESVAAINQGQDVEEVVDLESQVKGRPKDPFHLIRNMSSICKPTQYFRRDTLHLERVLRANIGDFTFQEAFDRTGRILNISVSSQSRSDPPRLLNYLSAPHVLIWSAALASSALPGVFDASRLIVRGADGTERYESTSAMAFQDGSMTADLPMQQLSEMFNVNHFIISQVNPNAVLFAPFDHGRTWDNPCLDIFVFLKRQVGSWLKNMFHLCGGHLFAPMWEHFLTQERFGRRDVDISIIPWQNHRSILSSFLNLIKNPSPDEFHSWIKAAERETWRFIPRIKSHCAEERTLDLCVQRLRKRIVAESCTDKKSILHHNDGVGTSKFIHSASFPNLVCLGGLGVLDKRLERTSLDRTVASSLLPRQNVEKNLQTPSQANHCRRGSVLSLPGNNSSKDLTAILRIDQLIEENDSLSQELEDSFADLLKTTPMKSTSSSGGSEDFMTPRQDDADQNVPMTVIAAPDTDTTKPLPSPIQHLHDDAKRKHEEKRVNNLGDGYLKTSHMASLYYRRKDKLNASSDEDEDKVYDQHSP
jgi:TAG lipase/steryl ester hydrolase/phospholipase A2/LPA acyltransferase